MYIAFFALAAFPDSFNVLILEPASMFFTDFLVSLPLFTVTVLSFFAPLNTALPIVLTFLPIITFFSFAHFRNAFLPIFTTFDPIVILVRVLLPLNAFQKPLKEVYFFYM